MNGVTQAYSRPPPTGTLYVVGTPIGNLGDLSSRAIKILESVDVVAAEDTRRTGRLLSSIGVQARLIACHDHNELARSVELVAALEAGESVALVSDAGMPLISDPGWRVVKQARDSGYPVVSVPGPSAVTAALSFLLIVATQYVRICVVHSAVAGAFGE